MGISVTKFIRKWQRVELTERSVPQQYFLNLKAADSNPVRHTVRSIITLGRIRTGNVDEILVLTPG